MDGEMRRERRKGKREGMLEDFFLPASERGEEEGSCSRVQKSLIELKKIFFPAPRKYFGENMYIISYTVYNMHCTLVSRGFPDWRGGREKIKERVQQASQNFYGKFGRERERER